MNDNTPTRVTRAHEVAHALIGTAGDLRDHATMVEIYDYKFCCEIDNHAFQCECCGWWCAIEEMTADQICDECYESDNK